MGISQKLNIYHLQYFCVMETYMHLYCLLGFSLVYTN